MCTARSRTALAFSREQSRELARARTISLRNRTYVGDCRARMTYELACVRGRLARGEASRASPHLLAASAKFWTSERTEEGRAYLLKRSFLALDPRSKLVRLGGSEVRSSHGAPI